jgi:hypothetical protein
MVLFETKTNAWFCKQQIAKELRIWPFLAYLMPDEELVNKARVMSIGL